MSLFDPHQLYSHKQKYSHKGQVLQKYPQKRISAIGEDMIPNAINVLKTYGYYINRSLPQTDFFWPFTYHQENVNSFHHEMRNVNIFNRIYSNEETFRTFVAAHDKYQTANIAIGISSILYYYQGHDLSQGDYLFTNIYYNGVGQTLQLGQIPTSPYWSALMYGAPSKTYVCWAYDTFVGNTSNHDAHFSSTTRDPIPFDNTICYSITTNSWQFIREHEELPEESDQRLVMTSFSEQILENQIKTAIYTGYMYISLT